MENKFSEKEVLELKDREFIKWLKKFYEAIPKEKWITGHYTIRDSHCAVGHIMEIYADRENGVPARLRKLFNRTGGIVNINDLNEHSSIANSITKIDNPKDRVIKALNLKLANRL